MSPSSLTCPQCQANLKVPAAVPAGLKLKCPRCGTQLSQTTTGVQVPAWNGPPGEPAPATAVATPATLGRLQPAAVRPEAVPALADEDSRALSPAAALALIGLGGFLLLLLTAGLIAV